MLKLKKNEHFTYLYYKILNMCIYVIFVYTVSKIFFHCFLNIFIITEVKKKTHCWSLRGANRIENLNCNGWYNQVLGFNSFYCWLEKISYFKPVSEYLVQIWIVFFRSNIKIIFDSIQHYGIDIVNDLNNM